MDFYSKLNSLNLCGIYELDAGGQITYHRMNHNSGHFNCDEDLIGSNFFDIAGFENINDFRRRIRHFLQHSDSMENFNFDCRFSEGVSNVEVKLARFTEREFNASKDFVVVEIRENRVSDNHSK